MPAVVSQLTVNRQTDDCLGLGSGKGLGKGLGKGSGLGKGAADAAAVCPGDREWLGITPEKLEMWGRAYPAIDLQIELSKAFAWTVANPNNRKSNWERFLTSWFNKAQDRAPAKNRIGGLHDQRTATLDALTGRNRTTERDITADSAVVG